jgi:hypothetical protein
MQGGLDLVSEEQRIAVDKMAQNQREALNRTSRDMQESEARIFDNMALNADRMDQRIQDLVTSGDHRAQDDRRQILTDIADRQQAMEARISHLIGNVTLAGGQTLGDVEQILNRQRQMDTDQKQQERLEIDRQAREIAMEVSMANSEVFARLIAARFTTLETALQEHHTGPSVGDIEQILIRQRESEAIVRTQERRDIDEQTRQIVREVTESNSDQLARLVGARFTEMEASFRDHQVAEEARTLVVANEMREQRRLEQLSEQLRRQDDHLRNQEDQTLRAAELTAIRNQQMEELAVQHQARLEDRRQIQLQREEDLNTLRQQRLDDQATRQRNEQAEEAHRQVIRAEEVRSQLQKEDLAREDALRSRLQRDEDIEAARLQRLEDQSIRTRMDLNVAEQLALTQAGNREIVERLSVMEERMRIALATPAQGTHNTGHSSRHGMAGNSEEGIRRPQSGASRQPSRHSPDEVSNSDITNSAPQYTEMRMNTGPTLRNRHMERERLSDRRNGSEDEFSDIQSDSHRGDNMSYDYPGSPSATETDEDYAYDEGIPGIRRTGRKAPLSETTVVNTAIGRAVTQMINTGRTPSQPFLKPTQQDIDYISNYVALHADFGTFVKYPPEPYRQYYLACQKSVLTVQPSVRIYEGKT